MFKKSFTAGLSKKFAAKLLSYLPPQRDLVVNHRLSTERKLIKTDWLVSEWLAETDIAVFRVRDICRSCASLRPATERGCYDPRREEHRPWSVNSVVDVCGLVCRQITRWLISQTSSAWSSAMLSITLSRSESSTVQYAAAEPVLINTVQHSLHGRALKPTV